MHLELLSTSLSATSRSRTLLASVAEACEARGVHVYCTDIRDLPQVFCDGRALAAYPSALQALHHRLESADGVVIAMPVYCYSVSGPAKNLVDIVGSALEKKSVAIISAAGSGWSHLAIRDLICALVFEFGTYVCPATVQVTGESKTPEALDQEVEEFAEDFMRFVQALAAPVSSPSAQFEHAE
jgi:FMN reductase